VDSMYNALIHPLISAVNNKMIWKMKIPLKTKVFGWYLRRGVILTKNNLAKRNWHGNKSCVFCHHDETIKHLFFQCRFARSIWSIIQVASTLYPSRSLPISSEIVCTVSIIGLERLLGWERLQSSGRYGYVEMIECLIINRLLLCRSSTGVPVHSVYGRLFSGWSTEAYLRRFMHGWRLRRRILFPIMGGSTIFRSSRLSLRRSCICSF
jgi:hypothetical protein